MVAVKAISVYSAYFVLQGRSLSFTGYQIAYALWGKYKKPIFPAAASEHEASEQGSSLIGIKLHYRGLKSLFSLNARNCGRMKGVKNCGYARMKDLGCAVFTYDWTIIA